MKIINCFVLIGCTFFMCSCNFSAGVKKDLSTGLSYSYNGFSVEEVLLVGPDNAAMNNNEVEFGTKVAIVVQGLTNYVIKDDKAFPGLMLTVTDNNGTSILNEADLFADNDGYSATDAAILRGAVTVGEPMKSGETYHMQMRVWDKSKPENELTADVDIVVK